MANKSKTKNFLTKLSLACSTDDLRPSLTHVYFDKGFAIATDGTMIIKSPLDEHGFTGDEIRVMNGRFIHSSVFNEIYRFDSVIVTEDGFNCFKGQINCVFRFTEYDGKFPNYEAVFPLGDKFTEVDKIGMSSRYLSKINLLTLSESGHLFFHFTGKNKAIIIKPELTHSKEVILLMPVMIGL